MTDPSSVVVDTVIRKDNLSRFFFFSVLFHKRTTLPVLLFSVLTGISLIIFGGYALTLGMIVLSFDAYYIFNLLKNHRNYLQYSTNIGVRQQIEIQKKGIFVRYPDQDREEHYNWKAICKTAEIPRLIMLYLDHATAILIPKDALKDQQLPLLRKIVRANFSKK